MKKKLCEFFRQRIPDFIAHFSRCYFSAEKYNMKRSQKVSLNSLRGHLALNSSALKPTINKLQSQHLIQDQMTNHYYNLATIKPAIDSKAPSSTKRSIKKQDQMRRSAIIKKIQLQQEYADQGYSPPPEPIRKSVSSSTRPKSSSYSQQDYKNSPYTTNNPMLRSSLKINMNQTMRPKSANNATFKVNSTTDKLNKTMPRPSAREVTYNGDYLNRHSDRFVETEGKPFVPRTKKRNAKSFLSQSRHYAPPVRRPKTQKPKSPAADEDNDDYHEMNVTAVTFERTQDHERWVEDQAQFVQTLNLNDEYDQEYEETCSGGRKTPANKAFEKAMTKPPFRDYHDAKEVGKTRQKIMEEEEELKYLSFINQVTNDILSRGIYSNTVLVKTMERHMQSRLHDLDERKMRAMLADLQANLGIVDTDEPKTTENITNRQQQNCTNRQQKICTNRQQQNCPNVTDRQQQRATMAKPSTGWRSPPPPPKSDSVTEEIDEVEKRRSVAPSPVTSVSSIHRRGSDEMAKKSNGTDEYESVSALATVLKVKDDEEGEDEVFTSSPTNQPSSESDSSGKASEKKDDKSSEEDYSDDFNSADDDDEDF